ncbi:MAG: hypothetical protein WAU34_08420, partial [Desulfobacterales bacterium]
MKTTKSNSTSLMSTAELPACRRCRRFTVLCVIGLALLAPGGDEGRAAEQPAEVSNSGVSATEPQAFPVAHIYCADRNGRYLQAEERIFAGSEGKIDRGRAIIE